MIGDRSEGLKGHVAGALDGPLVVLLEQDRANQSGDGGLVGEDADDFGASLDFAVERRSSGLVECNFARCWVGKVM